jgi:hypothetical protein
VLLRGSDLVEKVNGLAYTHLKVTGKAAQASDVPGMKLGILIDIKLLGPLLRSGISSSPRRLPYTLLFRSETIVSKLGCDEYSKSYLSCFDVPTTLTLYFPSDVSMISKCHVPPVDDLQSPWTRCHVAFGVQLPVMEFPSRLLI